MHIYLVRIIVFLFFCSFLYDFMMSFKLGVYRVFICFFCLGFIFELKLSYPFMYHRKPQAYERFLVLPLLLLVMQGVSEVGCIERLYVNLLGLYHVWLGTVWISCSANHDCIDIDLMFQCLRKSKKIPRSPLDQLTFYLRLVIVHCLFYNGRIYLFSHILEIRKSYMEYSLDISKPTWIHEYGLIL